jgi:L-rhamnose-H+ transport protein
MNPFLGVILHAIGGLAAGSFYIPLRKVRDWSWESYWLIQGLAAWVVMPTLSASITTPDLGAVFAASPASAMVWTYVFGALWGIGGLTFGLSMRYLGMSLGYALALGFCAAFGTIVPPLFTGGAAGLFLTFSGWIVLLGMMVCLAGIAVCGYAGILKERELTDEQKRQAIKEFALTKGVAVAVFAGIMSACMAFAISAGQPIAQAALSVGTPSLYQNNPVFIFAMGGGFTTNFIWCLILNIKNKSLGDYRKGPVGQSLLNYALAASGGVIWYLQFFFYGMGTTQMGKYDFASWTIHMAFIIVFSNFWGLAFHEWKGSSRRTFRTIFAGLAILIFSTVIVGAGNYLEKLSKREQPVVEVQESSSTEPARGTILD